MNWFKTLWLSSEERMILKKAKNNELIEKSVVEQKEYERITGKPYQKIIYSNGNLTVIFHDGTTISKSNADNNLLGRVKNAYSQNDIEIMLMDKGPENTKDKGEIEQERKLVANNLEIFDGNSDFIVSGSQVYMRGVNLAMPPVVTASFIEILEKIRYYDVLPTDKREMDSLTEQLQALRMFWLKLALNTLPQSREDLLTFVRKNDVRITKNGNLILYRRIVSKENTDKELVTYVTQEYYRIKKGGNDPRYFAIYKKDGKYGTIDLNTYDPINKPTDIVPFCTLQQMYLDLPTLDNNDFTAWHGRQTVIKLGGIYRIPETDINLDNGLCAAGGLHAAAVNYDYSGFGDVPVVVLVNPSKAITVPVGETGKLRTTEMFVACINDKPHGIHFDESAISAFDSEYHDFTLEELEEAAKNKSFENLSVKDNVPAVSLVDLNKIRELLKNRVQKF